MTGGAIAWPWVALTTLVGAVAGFLIFGRHFQQSPPVADVRRLSGSWRRLLPFITVVTPVVAVLTLRSNPHATLIVGPLMCAFFGGFWLGINPVWLWPEIARRRAGANRP
jgi:hypothetical protein